MKGENFAWRLSEELVTAASNITAPARKDRCSHLNQALMELGALICTPKQPKCLLCPVRANCVAYRTGKAGQLPNYEITVDLEQRKLHDAHGFSATFQIDEFTRHCLLEGLDDIALTLQHEADISAYEARHSPPRS